MTPKLGYPPEGYKTSPEALQWLLEQMEEMAGKPKEEYGKRQPGERCMYEINRRGLQQSSGSVEESKCETSSPSDDK